MDRPPRAATAAGDGVTVRRARTSSEIRPPTSLQRDARQSRTAWDTAAAGRAAASGAGGVVVVAEESDNSDWSDCSATAAGDYGLCTWPPFDGTVKSQRSWTAVVVASRLRHCPHRGSEWHLR